ncbi:hypothetical protein [Janthinobacterium agaricidamnosum]|uniref:hypothetical protein n=1 Tax=Janthinobacterium agaricidamnosum TaxID=55508 RepID=UPI0006909955|nr:hypothetical protein [Janthinobacterium agaricidamnosum]
MKISAQTALYKIAGNKALNITASRSKTNMNAFHLVLKKIANVLSKVKGAPHHVTLMKPTDLSGSVPSIEGTHVKAQPLSILSAPPGSSPSDGRLMKAIRASAGTEGSSYVQMHLLNDLVFGPGELWNLPPGPTQSNRTMESKIEDPLKRAIPGPT